jgi:predicted RNase H-like HicB family nuclease
MSTPSRDPLAPVPPEITARAREIARRPYRKVIEGDDDEGYLISVPDLPGCMTAGATIEEAVSMLPEAMMGWLESVLMRGQSVPEPSPEISEREVDQLGDDRWVALPVPMRIKEYREVVEQAKRSGFSRGEAAFILIVRGLARERRRDHDSEIEAFVDETRRTTEPVRIHEVPPRLLTSPR